MTHGSWASAERDAVIRQLYPTDATRDAIWNAILALPGPPPPSWKTVVSRAIQALGLTRGTERADTIRTSLEADARTAVLPVNLPRDAVDWDTVVKQAATWGIAVRDWEDLPKVNAHAELVGHPGFKRRFGRRGVR